MKRDAINFGSDKIPGLFRKIFIPTLIGMVSMALMTTIDGVFVGHGVGSDALAAVNIFVPFWMMVTGLGQMFGIGCSVVAAFSIACYIMPFIFMTGNAISQSAQPIISFNHGAGNRSRVHEARKVSLRTALGLGIVVSLALALAPGIRYVAAMFLSKDVPAYSIAAHGVPLMAIGYTLAIVNVAAIGYFQSVERALPATIFSLSRGVLFLVPCFMIIPLFAGVNGIWLSLPATEALTFLSIAAFRIISKRRKRIYIHGQIGS